MTRTRQLAKTMLLVLVVYIYYVSPIVDENVLMRLLFSTGFFVAIALASLPLVRRPLPIAPPLLSPNTACH